jgi:TRAP-type C4-dicarboxylate transport system permease small subunit
MSKKVIYTLILIGVTVVVLLFNVGSRASIQLPFGWALSMRAAFAYLIFTGIGVVIGCMVK